MNQTNEWKDRWLRYNFIFNQRVTNRQKHKFIHSLLGDLKATNKKSQVVEIENASQFDVRNIYIGDIKKADTIIATYYDSPTNFFGFYPFFDIKLRQKKALFFNALMGLLVVLMGAVYTYYIAMPVMNESQGINLRFVLVVLSYLVFLVLLRKATLGFGKRNNAIRNNATLMYLINEVERNRSAKIAYAFVDFGCKSALGLRALQEIAPKNATIFYLDSIGAQQPLTLLDEKMKVLDLSSPQSINKGHLYYVIAGQEENGQWLLKAEDYNKKEINQDNFQCLDTFLENYIKER